MKGQKDDGDKCSPKVNTFLLSESISHQWFKQMAYCVLDYHIKSNDKKHRGYTHIVLKECKQPQAPPLWSSDILVVALCPFLKAFTLQGRGQRKPQKPIQQTEPRSKSPLLPLLQKKSCCLMFVGFSWTKCFSEVKDGRRRGCFFFCYKKYFCIQLVLTQLSLNSFITLPQRSHMCSNYCSLSFQTWGHVENQYSVAKSLFCIDFWLWFLKYCLFYCSP